MATDYNNGGIRRVTIVPTSQITGGTTRAVLSTGDERVPAVLYPYSTELEGGVEPITIVSGANLDGGVMPIAIIEDVPAVKFNFMDGLLDPRLDFTRSNAAWYFNSSGLLTQAQIDQPRFDYGFPGSTTLQGLLIEGGATNEALQSRDLTNASWTKVNVTALKDQTGIDGVASSASKITASAGNGTCLQAVTSTSSVRVLSAYVKRLVGSGNIQMTMDNGSTWTTVTVTANWTRVAVPSQTLTNPTIGFRIVTSGDSIAVDCVQEEKRAVPTSPIPTTSAAGNRNQEVLTCSGTNFTSFYNQVEGTIKAEFMITTAQISGTERNVLSIDNDTANERIMILADNGSAVPRASITDGGVSQAALLSGAVSLNTVHKVVFAYKLNSVAANIDGGAFGTDTAATMPTPTQMKIGSRYNSTTSQLFGYIRSISYWAERKVTPYLEAL